MRILVLCTGNSTRSQMAEGFLKSIDPSLQVESAGTAPAREINPHAVRVMRELGVDISRARPKNVDRFLRDDFDYLITVCDNAKETCPAFTGNVAHRLHFGFEDPSTATGTEEHVLSEFRRIRDKIKEVLRQFYKKTVVPSL